MSDNQSQERWQRLAAQSNKEDERRDLLAIALDIGNRIIEALKKIDIDPLTELNTENKNVASDVYASTIKSMRDNDHLKEN